MQASEISEREQKRLMREEAAMAAHSVQEHRCACEAFDEQAGCLHMINA